MHDYMSRSAAKWAALNSLTTIMLWLYPWRDSTWFWHHFAGLHFSSGHEHCWIEQDLYSRKKNIFSIINFHGTKDTSSEKWRYSPLLDPAISWPIRFKRVNDASSRCVVIETIRVSKLQLIDFICHFQTHYTLVIPMICIVNILGPQFERNRHFKVRYLVRNRHLYH